MFDLIDTVMLWTTDNPDTTPPFSDRLLKVSLSMMHRYHHCSLLHVKITRLVYMTMDDEEGRLVVYVYDIIVDTRRFADWRSASHQTEVD